MLPLSLPAGKGDCGLRVRSEGVFLLSERPHLRGISRRPLFDALGGAIEAFYASPKIEFSCVITLDLA